jgi:alkanesulfonate monooxygenase SsuD/methylene tetrahydromethanopterin reductase-like flavin-dependent oxidoreductase (luciferase family)
MDVGIGLPTTVPGVSGVQLMDWARRSEDAGFSTLGALDRLVYDNYEPIVSLAAAAAVTERIRLATTILIAAYRDSAAVLAKQVATLQELSGGRMLLGVAAGGREDDYVAAGTRYDERGRRLDAMLTELDRIWAGRQAGGDIGPIPRPAPPIVIGGHSLAAMRRAARHGTGWIAGGSSVAGFAVLAEQAREVWREAGRAEEPRILSLAYVSIGPDGRERAERYLRRYYAFLGMKADKAAAGVLIDKEQARDHLASYAEAGCDELLLLPCDGDPRQVQLIAEAVSR